MTAFTNVRRAVLMSLALLPVLAVPCLAQGYVQTNLVSDGFVPAAHIDPNLVNPWGIAHSGGSPFWISDNGTGLATLYNGAGAPQSLVVTVPPPMGGTGTATPTGQVFNGSPGFQVAPGKPGLFIVDTEDGTISAWNPGVNTTHFILMVDNSAHKAVYKGLTLASIGTANYLYAANFHSGRIEVYDTNFMRVGRDEDSRRGHDTDSRGHHGEDGILDEDAFKDPHIPGNYSPFNIQNIGGRLYVGFARRDRTRHDEVDGPGLGYVDVFSPTGELVQRLEHGWWLNAPWGVALAPASFGQFSGDLLVGNFGSGLIAAYNPATGRFLGLVRDSGGMPVVIDGLWALTFGNGGAGGSTNTLYFTAGLNGEQDGLFGSLTPAP